MVRTRVGYSGGSTKNPTYHNLGDHAEATQVDYDPAQVSYQQLLEIFWESHEPTHRSWSPQYRSAVFFHNEQQERLAFVSKERLAARLRGAIHTAIEPAGEFYRAEAYHQKYRLRHAPDLMRELGRIYPDDGAFVDSTVAARLNGYLGGYGDFSQFQAELSSLGFSDAGGQRLLEIGRRLGRSSGLFC